MEQFIELVAKKVVARVIGFEQNPIDTQDTITELQVARFPSLEFQ